MDTNEVKRSNAMKTFYSSATNETKAKVWATKPFCGVQFNGKDYNIFSDTYCIVFTRKSIPSEIETYNEYYKNHADDLPYPKDSMISIIREKEKYEEYIGCVDFNKIITDAKMYGYKKSRKKDNQYFLRYQDCFLNLRLIDRAYSIIDNGKKAKVFYMGSPVNPLKIETNIGFTLILPINITQKKYDEIKKYEVENETKIIFDIRTDLY